MTEWKAYYTDLWEIANASPLQPFQSFLHDGTAKGVLKTNIYFGATDAHMAERALRKLQSGITDVCQMFTIKPFYNASPDKVTMLIVQAKGCHTMVIK